MTMETGSHKTLHVFCLPCWEAAGADPVYSYRQLLQETCCSCGEVTVGVVYLRKLPHRMNCRGIGPAHKVGHGVHRKDGEGFWEATGIRRRGGSEGGTEEQETDDLDSPEAYERRLG